MFGSGASTALVVSINTQQPPFYAHHRRLSDPIRAITSTASASAGGVAAAGQLDPTSAMAPLPHIA